MKVSVITVCYNSASTIEATIRSVISQSHESIEYIVVDGKSEDNTLGIVKQFSQHIYKIISEKDEGIYFAINKGIAAATGDVVAILHADDFYANTQVIADVVFAFNKEHADAVYGDLEYVDRNDIKKVTRTWISGNYTPGLFKKGWMPPHPSFFVKRSCYEKFGVFNTTLHSAADYELMLRFIHKHNCTVTYLPRVLVKMRVGGKSNVSFWNRFKANREDKKAWKINGLKPGLFTFIRKPLSKISQFF